MEGSAGLYLGRYGLGLEDLVLQASYTFTYVEKETGGGAATEQYRVNRSDADLSLSYVITSKFIAGAGVAFRYTHDGFDLQQYPTLDPNDPLIIWHDPVLRARYLAPAAVASYQITPAWSVAARVAAVVWGENVSNPLSFGLTLGWESNLID
jgi:long-subunit fatty acid transport protein